MKKKLTKILTGKDGKFYYRRATESFFKKNYILLYQKIQDSIEGELSFSEKLYLILNDLNKKPTCKMCANDVRFKKISQGYSKYCSMKCIGKDKEVQKKREETSLCNNGFKYTLESKEKREEIKKVNLERYGFEIPQKSEIIKKKTKDTNLKRYGVDHHLKLKEQQKKQKKTNLKRYGVENVSKLDSIKEKRKETNLKRYGVDNPNNLKHIREKIKNTNLNRFGVEHSFMSDEIKEKIKQTNLKKYGYESPQKSRVIKSKIIDSIKNTLKSKSISLWKEKLNTNSIILSGDSLIIKNYCNSHDQFIITKGLLKNRLRYGIKEICTKCNPINENVSIKEKELQLMLEKITTIDKNNRNVLDRHEIDVYLPNYKLGVEFNELYYHSDIFKENNYHVNKTEIAEKNNIRLIQIFEDEWIYKKDIIESIIKNQIGLVDKRIYARNCELKEIESNTANEFLDKNHIQGHVNSSVRLGLYYDEELVSVMTFGKKRKSLGFKNNDNTYEMYRFCNKLNISIIGGASKLFKYFTNKYNPQEVITYSDRRYFSGDIYEKLGFKFEKNTKPNYWYVKGMERYHRFKYRKDMLVKEGYDNNLTEREIMIERGYIRIYDSGNKKFVYFKQ